MSDKDSWLPDKIEFLDVSLIILMFVISIETLLILIPMLLVKIIQLYQLIQIL